MAKKQLRKTVSMAPVTYERLTLLAEIAEREGHPLLEHVPAHCHSRTSYSALVEAMIHQHADAAGVPGSPTVRPRQGVGGVHSW